MRAAILLSSSDGDTYGQYVTLWSIAARSGWGIAGVFDGSGDSLDELRQMITRRAVGVVLAWSAARLSRSLLDAIGAAGCGLYSYGPDAPPPAAEPEQNVQIDIACTRAQGKSPGRPRVKGATEQAILAALAKGLGIRKTARECGVGVSVVQRIKTAGVYHAP